MGSILFGRGYFIQGCFNWGGLALFLARYVMGEWMGSDRRGREAPYAIAVVGLVKARGGRVHCAQWAWGLWDKW